MQKIRRKVVECYDGDGGRSICRLDPDSLVELYLSPGDIVRITGGYDAYAKVWRSDRGDWNENQVLIDEFIRYNTQAEIGDTVTIEKVGLNPIEQITLLPYRGDNIEFGVDANEKLKEQQLDKPVQVGSVIAAMLSDSEGLLPLVVTGPHKREPGVITESTTIEFPEPFQSDSQSE